MRFILQTFLHMHLQGLSMSQWIQACFTRSFHLWVGSGHETMYVSEMSACIFQNILSITSSFTYTQHVKPLRSASKTKLFSGSLDNVRTHTLSTSTSTTPVHSVNPTFSLKINGYTSDPTQTSTPTHNSSATNPSFSDMSSGENMNSNTTELKTNRSDGRRFSDSEEQRNRKEPRDVNSTV